MKRSHSPILAALAVALLMAATGAWAQISAALQTAGNAPAGNAQNGKRIYTGYGCYQCHGREGQGSSATGPRLGPRPVPLSAFLAYVRRPAGQMPPYSTKVASDTELEDIHAFLESLPQPPEAKSLRLLN